MPDTDPQEHISQALQTFYPCKVGDPVGNLEGAHFFPDPTPMLWAVATLSITLPLTILLLVGRRPAKGIAAKVAAACRSAAILLLPPLCAAAIGLAAHAYWGGPFNYDGYRIPKRTADVVIWFTGSDDGTFTQYYAEGNINRAYCQFGYQHAAIFSFADVQRALDYARRLPATARLLVRGHSMGGAAAVRFACQSPRDILLLDTRDPTSWTRRTNEKPPRVRYWRNLIPEVIGLFPPQKEHPGTNYAGPVNMANLFRFMGGAWKPQPGALNLTLPNHDHHSIGNNLKEDPCVLHMP